MRKITTEMNLNTGYTTTNSHFEFIAKNISEK